MKARHMVRRDSGRLAAADISNATTSLMSNNDKLPPANILARHVQSGLENTASAEAVVKLVAVLNGLARHEDNKRYDQWIYQAIVRAVDVPPAHISALELADALEARLTRCEGGKSWPAAALVAGACVNAARIEFTCLVTAPCLRGGQALVLRGARGVAAIESLVRALKSGNGSYKSISPSKYADSLRATLRRGASALESVSPPFANAAWACRHVALEAFMAVKPDDRDNTTIEALRGLEAHKKAAPTAMRARARWFALLETELKPWQAAPSIIVEWYLRHASALDSVHDYDGAFAMRRKGRGYLGCKDLLFHGLLFCGDFERKANPVMALAEAARCLHASFNGNAAQQYDASMRRRAWAALAHAPAALRRYHQAPRDTDRTAELVLLALGDVAAVCERRDGADTRRADAQRADAYWHAAVLAAKRAEISVAIARCDIAAETSLRSRTVIGLAAVAIASLCQAADARELRNVNTLFQRAIALPESSAAAWTALSDCLDRLGRSVDAAAVAAAAACRCEDIPAIQAAVERFSRSVARLGNSAPSLLAALRLSGGPLASLVLQERFRVCQAGESGAALVTAAEELACWDALHAARALSCASIASLQYGRRQAGLALAQRSLKAVISCKPVATALASCTLVVATSRSMFADDDDIGQNNGDSALTSLMHLSDLPRSDITYLASAVVALGHMFAANGNFVSEALSNGRLAVIASQMRRAATTATAVVVAGVGFSRLAQSMSYCLEISFAGISMQDRCRDVSTIEARHSGILAHGMLKSFDGGKYLATALDEARAACFPRAELEACLTCFDKRSICGNNGRCEDAARTREAVLTLRPHCGRAVLLKDSALSRDDAKSVLWLQLAEIWLARGCGSRAGRYVSRALGCEPGVVCGQIDSAKSLRLRIATRARDWLQAAAVLKTTDTRHETIPVRIHRIGHALDVGDLMRRQGNLKGAEASYLDANDALILTNDGDAETIVSRLKVPLSGDRMHGAVFSRHTRRVLLCAARIIDIRSDRQCAVTAYRTALLSPPSNKIDGAYLCYRLGCRLLHRASQNDAVIISEALNLLRCAYLTARRSCHRKLATNSARVFAVAILTAVPGAFSSPLVALLVHASLGRARLATEASDDPDGALSAAAAQVYELLDTLLAGDTECLSWCEHLKANECRGTIKLDQLLAPLPRTYVTVATVIAPTGHIVVARLQHGRPPLTLCRLLPPRWYVSHGHRTTVGVCQEALCASSLGLRTGNPPAHSEKQSANTTFQDEMNNLDELGRPVATSSMNAAKCKAWWRQRHTLDTLLEGGLGEFEETWLGPLRALLVTASVPTCNYPKIMDDERTRKPLQELMRLCVNVEPRMSNADVNALLRATAGIFDAKSAAVPLSMLELREGLAAAQLSAVSTLKAAELTVILGGLRISTVGLKKQLVGRLSAALQGAATSAKISKFNETCGVAATVKRQPLILALDERLQRLPIEDLAVLRAIPTSRVPSIALVLALAARMHFSAQCVGCYGPSRICCVVDPEVNLPTTRKTLNGFLDSVQQHRNVIWVRIATERSLSSANIAAQLANELRDCAIYLFCGHGHGAVYLNCALESRRFVPTSLLMGCSSGTLSSEGDFEPRGIPLELIARGAPTVVAMLWDVTDRDIDRVTLNLLDSIGSHVTRSFPELLNDARAKTKLRKLNGAAPVCYGLPVSLADIERAHALS